MAARTPTEVPWIDETFDVASDQGRENWLSLRAVVSYNLKAVFIGGETEFRQLQSGTLEGLRNLDMSALSAHMSIMERKVDVLGCSYAHLPPPCGPYIQVNGPAQAIFAPPQTNGAEALSPASTSPGQNQ